MKGERQEGERQAGKEESTEGTRAGRRSCMGEGSANETGGRGK